MRRVNPIVIIVLVVLLLAALAVAGWFMYDNTVDRSGWEEADGTRYYLDFYGDRVTGWRDIDANRYYFLEDNTMATQWQEIDGHTYFFGEDGIRVTGWMEIGGQTCFFNEKGIRATDWQEIEGKRYYFRDGILASGWQEINGNRYYFAADGTMVTGAVTVDGTLYLFGEDGTPSSGWHEGCYYLSDGSVATGWQEIEGKRYYFNDDGTAYTGWLDEGEYRYYLLSDGSAAVGPYEIDGYTYHFSPSGIQIWLVNENHLIPEFYTTQTVLTEGGVHLDRSCTDAFTSMLTDCQAAGNAPHARVGYRSYWDQLWIVNDTLEHVGQSGLLYVAQPNASEHQLGLAVDVTDSNVKVLNASQEQTGTFKWLSEHCWEYGFILRYPNGTTDITGIGYEPWHYRYVGVEVAMEMKELGITLEEYLGAA